MTDLGVYVVLAVVAGFGAIIGGMLWYLFVEARANRALVKSAFIHMKASTPAEAVAAEADLRQLDEPDEDPYPDVEVTTQPDRYTTETGHEYISSWDGGIEFWVDPKTGDKFEVSE